MSKSQSDDVIISDQIDIFKTLKKIQENQHNDQIGTLDFLIHKLYDFPIYDVYFVIPQLCALLANWDGYIYFL